MSDRTNEQWAQEDIDAEQADDDSPFCECGLEPIEDEDASNQCFCCGKPLR